MKKQLLKVLLLATLPMVAVQADSNLSASPFENDPVFKHFQKLQQEMDRVFKEFNSDIFQDMKIDSNFAKDLTFKGSPNTDLLDKGDTYELKMDLAGMDDNSIKIDIQENYLNVTAKSEKKKEQKEGDKIIHQERHVGMVQRGMTLPKDADTQNYKSDYKNGVLTITIPKKK